MTASALARFLRRAPSLLGCLAWLATAAAASAQSIEHPLKPPDTSSAEATLRSFLTEMREVYRIADDDDASGSARPLARAASLFDLSQTPPPLRANVGIEAALMLKETLDRIEVLPVEAVPNPADDTPDVWRIPNTEIFIVRIEEGTNEGEHLFSAETVRRAPEFFAVVRNLPYRPGSTPGLYEAYLSTPGRGVDRDWSERLPDWSTKLLGGQTWWQWIALALTAVALAAAMAPAFMLSRRAAAATEDQGADRSPWSLVAAAALAAAAVFAAGWFLDEVVNITGDALVAVVYVLAFLRVAMLGWLAVLLVSRGAAWIVRRRGLQPTAAGAVLIRFASWSLVGLAIVALLMAAAQDFGLPAYSVVTGLGVGGIAIGFGAQTLVRDILSGVFFLIDDAFREGEYIDAGLAKGTVENITLRSIQLRHHNGPLNTIPFGEIKHVTNLSRDWVIMKFPIRVPFGTDTEKVRKVVKKLGLAMLEDPEFGELFVEPLKSQGVFQIDDFGIVIRVKYMTRPGDQFILRRVVYARLQTAFAEAGIEIAGREVRVRTGEEGAAAKPVEDQTLPARIAEIGGDQEGPRGTTATDAM